MKFSIESDESSDDDRPSGGVKRIGNKGYGHGSSNGGDLETVELYSKYSPQQGLQGKPRTAPPGGASHNGQHPPSTTTHGSSSNSSSQNNVGRKDKDKSSTKGTNSHGNGNGKGFSPQQMLTASIPGLGGRGGGEGRGSGSKHSKVWITTYRYIPVNCIIE